jgi:hypothetical protein
MRRVPLLGALVLALPALLSAQVMRGRAVSAETGAPVAGALVEVRRGDWTGRAVTTGSGAFAVTGSGTGRYAVRVAAIGFVPTTVERDVGTDAVVDLGDVALSRAVFTLEELTVEARSRCDANPQASSVLGRLLDNAHTALAVMEAGVGQNRFQVERVARRAVRGRRDSLVTADTTRGELADWPIVGLPPDSLRQVGFSVSGGDDPLAGRQWFGPDVRVLFADWFLESHCFRLERDSRGAGPIEVRFEPADRNGGVDVAGRFEIDRQTLGLRHFAFEHRRLPRGMREGVAGGEMDFAILPSGLWVPTRWRIFAPIQDTEGGVAGELSEEGRVVSFREGQPRRP